MRQLVREMVDGIAPFDEVEAEHRADVVAWLDSDVEVFRTAKPATPPKHLVSYCLLVDSDREQALLVDHRDAQLWLPSGGHIDPDEHPVVAAKREISEELQITPPLHPAVGEAPLMVTVTQTAGLSEHHTDVSLWFVFQGLVGQELRPDEREFRGVRWWPFDEIRPGPAASFDPHLPRFVEKLRGRLV